MCTAHKPAAPASLIERRRFLQLATLGAGGMLLAGALPVSLAEAAPSLPIKPANAINAAQALDRLKEGNQRYVAGVTKRHDFMTEREALVGGQNPFAAVLSCADSRIAPEHAFDTTRGDLFAVRVAGNFVTDDGLASLEYAVAVLGTPLIAVLGHDGCGAVSAGIKALQEDARFPGKIQGLAEALKPSVKKALTTPGDLLDNAIAQNVLDSVTRLRGESKVLGNAIRDGKLNIVGGIYRLGSGQVEWIA
ncbi:MULTISPECIES: carbonic anhydrase [Pseudomonas]|uniref:carbonic anhydrase n=1 Tax=Pseudomonas TaxID=286 RepID=UPI000CFC07E9|nr:MULTISPECIES: carbonic anhydrase [Pseudomonas]PQZ91330.1 carbonic anhydrase [Pseudomonas trivialis]PRB27177.1 carbonic anhydrase [Pseudomonas sp. MYb60]